jgi:hypothetical protein
MYLLLKNPSSNNIYALLSSTQTDKVFTPSQAATFNLLYVIRYPVHITSIKLHLTSYCELTVYFSASDSCLTYLFSSFRNSYPSLKVKKQASQTYFRAPWRFLPSVMFRCSNCWTHTNASENFASSSTRRMIKEVGVTPKLSVNLYQTTCQHTTRNSTFHGKISRII